MGWNYLSIPKLGDDDLFCQECSRFSTSVVNIREYSTICLYCALCSIKFIIIWGIRLHLHYGDVIMGAMASQMTSLMIVYSTVYSDQRKYQSSASLAFVRGDRWIPRTNGQLRGKCFHLMTSSCLSCNMIKDINESWHIYYKHISSLHGSVSLMSLRQPTSKAAGTLYLFMSWKLWNSVTFTKMVALKVVTLTTLRAASDYKVVNVTTYSF